MDWRTWIEAESQSPYFQKLQAFVQAERRRGPVYPPRGEVFNAFLSCPLDRLKVVIVGQDPYHGPGQAMGMSFSVHKGVEIPPSLRNIFREQGQNPSHGDLTSWAEQGVFLLNRILTVRAASPMSHAQKGWEIFTDHVLAEIFALDRPLVFMLWGRAAQSLQAKLKNPQHLYLCTSHPSPLAVYRGFEGCQHFQKANEYLISKGLDPIDWRIPD
ncbi:MAG: uracil-DNA glycosylase [Eubacteriales bacterium]|nr:uracil-DNA glycosylase [Eubacteriales bacterium]